MNDSNKNPLNYLFYPRNVAIYRASEKLDYFFQGFTDQKFDKSKIYPINSALEEVFGIKCYKSLVEVPEDTIDLLILAVARQYLAEALKDLLKQKEIKTIHIFTAGTGESDEEGKKVEGEVLKILNNKDVKTRAIGPNCMGVYSTKGRLAYEPLLPTEPGNISFVFQSGDLHSQTLRIGASRYNLKFSKGASVGNCLDLQISEFLEYYNQDIDTDIVGVYFEGFSKHHPKEGRNLLKTMKNMNKPVLFINGGTTIRAQKAVLTHTGSIGSNQKIWDAIVKQTPIVNVPTSMDDMIDYLYLFRNYINRFKKAGIDLSEISYPEGKNVLLILWSGGFGIIDTNILTELGLHVPYFEGETLEKLRKIYPIKIGSLSNPLDIPWISSSDTYLKVTKTAIEESIDLIMIETDSWGEFEAQHFKNYYNNLLQLREHAESLGKLFILSLPYYPSEIRRKFINMLHKDNFIVYPSVRRAGKAFLALYEYGKKKEILGA